MQTSQIPCLDSLNDYQYIKVLGQGYQSKSQTGQLVAIKFYSTQKVTHSQAESAYENERSILLELLNHPYVVNILGHGSMIDPEQSAQTMRRGKVYKLFFLVLEYFPNGSLLDLVQQGKMTGQTARYYCQQIAMVLNSLYSLDIVHRDLTLGNIMLNSELDPVMIDFTFATKYCGKRPRKLNEFIGTQPYMACEIADGAPYYVYPAEMFSLGVIFYILMYGRQPFESSQEEDETFIKFQQCEDGDEFIRLVKSMCNLNFFRRPSLQQVLAHEWLVSKEQAHTEVEVMSSKRKSSLVETQLI